MLRDHADPGTIAKYTKFPIEGINELRKMLYKTNWNCNNMTGIRRTASGRSWPRCVGGFFLPRVGEISSASASALGK